MTHNTYLYLFIMAAVSFAIRVLPLPEETEQPPAPPAPAADPAVV